MRLNFTKGLVFFVLLLGSLAGLAQPTITTPTAASITTTGATLGGNITSNGGKAITAHGTYWKTTTGVTAADNPLDAGAIGTGVFTQARTGMPSGSHIFYMAFATNMDGTVATSEGNFYTLSLAPTAHPASFTAAPNSPSQINLGFSAASTLTNGAGYIILRRSDGTNPDATGVANGVAPASQALTAGTTLVTDINSSATTTYPDNTGLSAATKYNYAIIAYNWDGTNAGTYDYYTAATIQVANSYTLSTGPTAQPASFTATTNSSTQINLAFSAASTITNAAGYIILKRTDGVDPTATGVTNGVDPASLPLAGGTTLLTDVASTATTTFNNTGLTAGSHINYEIIAYAWDGSHNQTYNYRTVATILTANAFTWSATPAAHPASFNATTNNASTIDLTFSAASTITNGSGYMILRRSDGTDPNATGVANGVAPSLQALTGGTTFVTNISSSATTSFSNNTGLSAATKYNYAIIVYDWDGSNPQTYSYRTAATIPTDNTYTASVAPSGYPAAFTATATSATQITLAFSAASTVTNAAGYIILRRSDGTNPTATGVTNGIAPGSLALTGGTTLVTTTTLAATTFADNGRTTGTQYNYAIIPFNYDGSHNATYNYYTAPTIPTDFDVPSAGATITAPTLTLCSGSYTSLGSIVITEAAKANFGASGTFILELDNPDFSFLPGVPSSVSFTAGQNITAATITVNASRVTLNITISGTNKLDQITIAGLKILYDGTSPPQTGHIIQNGGTATLTLNGTNFATINSNSSPPAAPVITTTPVSGVYCKGSNIAAVTASAAGASITWYNNVGVQVGVGNSINITTLGVSTASAPATFVAYATQTTTCQSAQTAVTFTISDLPGTSAGSDLTKCAGIDQVIGGSPTLVTPTISPTYTYAWTDNSPGTTYSPNAAAPNPVITVPDPGLTDATWNYTVTITDGNGCVGTDVMQLTAHTITGQSLSFTPADQTNFLATSPAQNLVPSVAGGTFTGLGVSLVSIPNPSPPPATINQYQFSPSSAGAGSNPLVTYSATLANGCAATVTNTFHVNSSSGFFVNNSTSLPLSPEYCNNEGAIFLRLTQSTLDNVMNFIEQWNTTYHSAYGYDLLKYQVSFRNYYESGIYGYGANGAITISGSTYTLNITQPGFNGGATTPISLPYVIFDPTKIATDNAYPGCPTCNYIYLGIYVPYQSPLFTYPYNIPYNTDYSYIYNVGGAGGVSAYNYSGDFANINFVPTVSFSGLASGLAQPNQFCDAAPVNPILLSGNQPHGAAGFFQISSTGSGSGFVSTSPPALGLSDNSNGTANFNPAAAYSALGNPGTQSPLWVTYNVNPGTKGSTNQFCTGTTPAQNVFVNPLPAITLPNPANPLDNTVFCYNGASVPLLSTPANGTIPASNTITWSGSGVVDNLSGNATYNPQQGFDNYVFVNGTNPTLNQTMPISAIRTDPYGCQNTATLNFTVKPLSAAVFTNAHAGRTTWCYEDAAETLNGQQATSFYTIVYLGTPGPYTKTVGSFGSPQPNYLFDPKALYDDAVTNRGATAGSPITFKITYSAQVAGCQNSVTVNFTVNPLIVLDFSIADGQIVCSSLLSSPVITVTGNIATSGSFLSGTTSTAGPFSVPSYLVNSGSVLSKADINLNQAYTALAGSVVAGGPSETLYIQYVSTGAGCLGSGSIVKTIHISAPPVVGFDPVSPADNQIFCRTDVPVTLQTLPTTGTVPTSTYVLSGFGVSDPGTANDGIGTFDPGQALSQWESANTTIAGPATTITLTAVTTDVNGCVNQITKPVVVNRIPPASVTLNPITTGLCYLGPNTVISGGQKAYLTITSNETAFTQTYGSTASPSIDPGVPTTFPFNPKTYFDNMVNNYGANPKATLSFNVVYTSFDPHGCLNSLAPILLKIDPQTPPTIGGFNDNDEICSTDISQQPNLRIVTLSPNGGTLQINGVTTPYVNQQYVFTPSLIGGDFVFNYDVITGNGCSNPLTQTLHVKPSPVAIPTITGNTSGTFPGPGCVDHPITFAAAANSNGVATYQWTINANPPVMGQNISNTFTSVGPYAVTLDVNYAPVGVTNLVCAVSKTVNDNTTLVGSNPIVDFSFANVCENDGTSFQYTSDIAVTQVQWDFGAGGGMGPLNPISPGGTPVNNYGAAGAATSPYDVTMIAYTAPSNGFCSDTSARKVTILKYYKNQAFTPLNPYSMKTLNGEDGFWKVEDRAGNSTWTFGAPAKPNFSSPDLAWVNGGLSGLYADNDQSYVNSPCFDLTAFTKPVISLNYWEDAEPGQDGAVLQYSVGLSGGVQQWFNVGGYQTGLEWFDHQIIPGGAPGGQSLVAWSHPANPSVVQDFILSKHTLSGFAPDVESGTPNKVRFRLAFGSNSSGQATPSANYGFAFNDVRIDERNRISLMENFSNEAGAISTVVANNETAYTSLSTAESVKIEYHTSFPGKDDINDLNPDDHNARAAFYGLTNTQSLIPKGFVDGFSNGDFTQTWISNYIPLRSLINAPVDVSIANPAAGQPDQISVAVTITPLKDIISGSPILYVGIVEKLTGGLTNVMRKMLPTASGTPIALPLTKGTPVTITLDPWKVTSITDISQLAIVAFVQDEVTKDIFQSTVKLTLDNPPSTFTGLPVSPSEAISIYPIPANKEFRITLPAPAKQNISLKITDQMGKLVHESIIPQGTNSKTVSTQDLAGGMYILQLDSGSDKDMVRRKVIVVHAD